MQFFPFVVVAWILAVGLYGIVTSRHLVHQIVCLIVVQSSTYVLLLGVGYKRGAAAPYFSDMPAHTTGGRGRRCGRGWETQSSRSKKRPWCVSRPSAQSRTTTSSHSAAYS